MSKTITAKILLVLITIGILIGAMPLEQAEAFNFQVDEGMLEENEELYKDDATWEEQPVSMLHKKLVLFLKELLTGLKQLFGLRTLDQMIFNEAEGKFILVPVDQEELEEAIDKGIVEEHKPYYKGVMPENWRNPSRTMHLIFQSIAWSILAVAIIKNLIEINLATLNPMIRRRFYDAIRDLFIAGFLLIASLLLVETMLTLNEKIVDVFYMSSPTKGFANIHAERRDMASFVLEAFYFGIEVYFNFTYVVRAISTALLIATAPLFVVSITFQSRNDLFFKWFREITSNIFMQAFHAFALSFILSVQLNTGTFERMVIMFALIPLTEFFRTLMTGESGSTNRLGMSAIGAGVGALASAGAGALEGNKRKANSTGSGSNSGERDGSTKNRYDSNSSSEGESFASPLGNNTKERATSESLSTLSREMSVGAETSKSSMGEHYNNYTQESNLHNQEKTTAKGNIGGVVKGGAKVMGGVALGAMGIGLGAATGNNQIINSLGKAGGNTALSGMGNISQGTFGMKNIIDDNANSGNPGGNIIHSEPLSNGNIALHRDRESVSDDGLIDVGSDGKGIHTFTYNDTSSNMNPINRERLNRIEAEYRNNNNRTELREQYGIERVSRGQDGHLRVEANKTYLEKMGIDSMQKTPNRYVENKRPDQNRYTDIVPELNIPKRANTEADRRMQGPQS